MNFTMFNRPFENHFQLQIKQSCGCEMEIKALSLEYACSVPRLIIQAEHRDDSIPRKGGAFFFQI
jgi:hypothetical protein